MPGTDVLENLVVTTWDQMDHRLNVTSVLQVMNNMEARAKTSTRYLFKDLIWWTMKYCLSIPKKSKSSETGVTVNNGIVLFLLICYK